MAQLNFDANTVAPQEALDPIPADWYPCAMVESEMKPTQDKSGGYLECAYQVIDGPYKGRKVFDRLNLHNKNQVAVEIAYRTLSAICHAAGVIQLQDSQQLHNRPLLVKVAIEPAKDGYDAKNIVKGYKAMTANQQPAPATQYQPGTVPPGAAANPALTNAQIGGFAPQQQPAPPPQGQQPWEAQQQPAPAPQQPAAPQPQQQPAPWQAPAQQAAPPVQQQAPAPQQQTAPAPAPSTVPPWLQQ